MTQPTDQGALLGEAKQALESLNRAKEERSRLDMEAKQLRKQLDAEKKAAEDAAALTVKKRREEINASYDKEIAKPSGSAAARQTEAGKSQESADARPDCRGDG